MAKLTTAQKVDQIHEYIVGNPLKNIPGIDNIVKQQQKEIEELKKTKANKFDWSKVFGFLKVAKTSTGV